MQSEYRCTCMAAQPPFAAVINFDCPVHSGLARQTGVSTSHCDRDVLVLQHCPICKALEDDPPTDPCACSRGGRLEPRAYVALDAVVAAINERYIGNDSTGTLCGDFQYAADFLTERFGSAKTGKEPS